MGDESARYGRHNDALQRTAHGSVRGGCGAPPLKRSVRPTSAMAFMRFVLARRHPESGVEAGLFSAAYDLRASKDLSPEHRKSLEDALSWIESNLATPSASIERGLRGSTVVRLEELPGSGTRLWSICRECTTYAAFLRAMVSPSN